MEFQKVVFHGRNYPDGPHWWIVGPVRFRSAKDGTLVPVWRNFSGGFCVAPPGGYEILETRTADSEEDFIEQNRREVYGYLLRPDSELGWLSPTGDFYGCEYSNHGMLAHCYFGKSEMELEKEGWIKIYRNLDDKPEVCVRRVSPQQREYLEDNGLIRYTMHVSDDCEWVTSR